MTALLARIGGATAARDSAEAPQQSVPALPLPEMLETHAPLGEVVELNVGGTVFTTFASTLTKQPDVSLQMWLTGVFGVLSIGLPAVHAGRHVQRPPPAAPRQAGSSVSRSQPTNVCNGTPTRARVHTHKHFAYCVRSPRVQILEYLRTDLYPTDLLSERQVPFFEHEVSFFNLERPLPNPSLKKLHCSRSLKVDQVRWAQTSEVRETVAHTLHAITRRMSAC